MKSKKVLFIFNQKYNYDINLEKNYQIGRNYQNHFAKKVENNKKKNF
ncbi:unnamed protein product [Paramecium sonneborni]|uniref:Uncharacterized protein n=1 Tax=Paramecium sonneborni TaxID=65129 RepID=A0A8S1L713_9CILI|nr:unnamed protein product [Paramecium sonneborni]